MHRHLIVSAALFVASVAIAPAQAQIVYGLVGSDRVVTFNASDPGTITSSRVITGLGANEVLTGIDIRPATGGIYSVGTSGNIYLLSPSGGGYAATITGALNVGGSPLALSGTNHGIDFNPVPDRLRLISNSDQNLRINVTGGGTTVDGMIQAPGGGLDFDIVGSAYTNSDNDPATGTMLFGIDALSSSLLRTDAPNAGVYSVIGGLGFTLGADPRVGFDILFSGGVNRAYLAANDGFYRVNLSTGAATLIGGIGADNVRGITTAVPEPATWAMMIGGFGLVGAAMRRRPRQAAVLA